MSLNFRKHPPNPSSYKKGTYEILLTNPFVTVNPLKMLIYSMFYGASAGAGSSLVNTCALKVLKLVKHHIVQNLYICSLHTRGS